MAIGRRILGLAAVLAGVAVAAGARADEAVEQQILPRKALFDPLIADPRWPHLSAAYQSWGGEQGIDDVAAVSFGHDLSFYQRGSVETGRWGIGLQAAVYSIFDLGAQSKDLVNADYFVAVPVSWRRGDWQAMGRVFHQSSHLGDEYLLRIQPERINLSYEGVDVKLARAMRGDRGRVYGGVGYLINREPSDLDPWTVQVGVEVRAPWTVGGNRLRPIGALDLQSSQEADWALDVSTRLGVEIESGEDQDYRLLLMLELYHGHNPNGQFYERSIDHIGVGIHAFF